MMQYLAVIEITIATDSNMRTDNRTLQRRIVTDRHVIMQYNIIQSTIISNGTMTADDTRFECHLFTNVTLG